MLRDVEDTFFTLQDAFTTAIKFVEDGNASQSLLLAQQQAVNILDVYDTFLGVDTVRESLPQQKKLHEQEQQQRAHVARLSLEGHFASLLVSLLSRHLPHVQQLDAQQQQQHPFLTLRMRSLLSLQRLVVACSESGDDVRMLFFRVVIHDGLLQQLLRALAESDHDPVRAGVGETLFIFLVRFRDGPAGFVGCGGVEAMCRAVLVDRSPAVRTVCAGVLRELSNTHAAALTGVTVVGALREGLTDSGAAEVRVLAAEVLEGVLLHRPDEVLRDTRAFLVALRCALLPEGGGGHVASVEAAARLVETATAAAAAQRLQEFFTQVVASGMVESLLQRLSSRSCVHYQENNGNAARARTLRMLLQYTPQAFALSRLILHNRELLAILLKTIIDAGRVRTVLGEDYAAFQIKNVELALCLAIIASQSSAYRDYLSRELYDYPQWGVAIKNAVVSLLNAASLDYFTHLELYDITGFHLNRPNRVNWDVDDTPQSESVEKLFQDQVVREDAMQKSVRTEHHTSLFPDVDPHAAEDLEKKICLTFTVLVHAINITFAVEGTMGAANPTAEMKPSFSESQTTKRTSLRFSKSPSAVLTGKQHQLHHQHQHRHQQQQHLRKHESAPLPGILLQSNLHVSGQSTMTNDEMEAMAIAYDKFNSSMSLVLKYAQHYHTKEQRVEDVVETEHGYIVHTSRLKNPWRTIVKNPKLKTWQISDLKVGDLFYFSLSFDDIGIDTLDTLVYEGRKHMAYLKKKLLTAPQANKGRRWFLHDMLKNIMPKVMTQLEDLKAFVQNCGGDGIRFPIFLFREKELHFGERAMHPGNVVEVINQIRFYLSQNVAKSVGLDDALLLRLAQQLDLERRANTNAVVGADSPYAPLCAGSEDETDDDACGYGHGTISSDSEVGV